MCTSPYMCRVARQHDGCVVLLWLGMKRRSLPEDPPFELAVPDKVVPQRIAVSEGSQVSALGAVQVEVKADRAPDEHCNGLAQAVAGLPVLIHIAVHIAISTLQQCRTLWRPFVCVFSATTFGVRRCVKFYATFQEQTQSALHQSPGM